MQIHVVRSGETLWQIAQRYHANLNQVILANDIKDPNMLVVGQAIIVPEPNREYVVQAGDQLWSIAQRLQVPIQELAQFNNLTARSVIYPGEVLKIPFFTHIVQQGETLWEIANKYGTTIEQIVQLNQITNPSMLAVGQVIIVPRRRLPVIEVNAYTTNINEEGRDEVLILGRNFTYISPFMHSIKEDGSLTDLQDAPILEAAGATNTSPLFVITNFRNSRFDSDLAASVLRNPAIQETLITNILEKMGTKGYSGLNIDFEYVYPEDRENYNAFLRRVVARLHPQGFTVSTAVAPKERKNQQGLLYEAHDYAAHGQIVDFVILMTYEWGWAGGSPRAIAPIDKVRDVLDYAVTVIPRNKIVMGVPLYGRDWKIPWVQGTFASTVSPLEAERRAARYGVAIQYDEKSQSPFYRYVDEGGQEHEVWFEDARSMQAKYDTVKQYQLRGVSYWVLGSPFPQNWPILQNNFTVRKH